MNIGKKSILDQVKAWEKTFFTLYKRKPRMIEREQYFIGRIHGLQSLKAVADAAWDGHYRKESLRGERG